ncbi:hypothetical protein ANCDUO_11039 [Ancylostoma duodenale]|uniref:HTH iclR-type domain-containing protein n=1 Tax=Ancylostoma duodenale TaxID=51022 RepID=A0A0C2CPR7_9BILA|nr:hypothetical protein ANCDUO_11039 [Ancylostoma duodenale]
MMTTAWIHPCLHASALAPLTRGKLFLTTGTRTRVDEQSFSYRPRSSWVRKLGKSSRSSRNESAVGNRSAASTELQIIEALYKADPGKSVFDLATELGVSPATVLSYLRSNVLKDAILNEPQLQNRLEICSALSLRNRREPFLSRIVTYGVKKLYFEYRKRLPYFPLDAARNLEQDIPGKKVLLTVWWSSRGVIYHQILERYEEMTTCSFYKHIAKARSLHCVMSLGMLIALIN